MPLLSLQTRRDIQRATYDSHVYQQLFLHKTPHACPFVISFSFAFLTCVGKIYSQDIIKVHSIFVLPTRMLVFIDLLLEEDKEENVTILPGRYLKAHRVLFLLSRKRGSASVLQEALGSRQGFLVCLFSNSRLESL